MNLIIETDIGHDPDDFFALCYFHSAGVNIRAILTTIGHPFQVELARFFCDYVGLDIPIGIASNKVIELKTGGIHFHDRLLKRFGYRNDKIADGLGLDVLKRTLNQYPDCEFFVCGPPKSFGAFAGQIDRDIERVTMQGGFLPYSLYKPRIILSKFERHLTVPTYNLNGARVESQAIINCPRIKNLSFVSKNICHTVVYNRERHDFVKSFPIKNKADELFVEGMSVYLEKHSEKKFHDPTAAVCHLHPEIATWFKGKLYSERGGWGTRKDEDCNSRIIADIDYEALWNLLGHRE